MEKEEYIKRMKEKADKEINRCVELTIKIIKVIIDKLNGEDTHIFYKKLSDKIKMYLDAE